MNIDRRKVIVNTLKFLNESEKADLLDDSLTKDSLLVALEHLVLPSHLGGLGHNLLITSVRSDHGDDSDLGPHGHAEGFALDCAPQNDVDARRLIQDICNKSPLITKLGIGGYYQSLSYSAGDTEVFNDNSTPHLHFQTQ